MISKVQLFGRQVYIKRDDLLTFRGVSGNKARKLKFLDEDANRSWSTLISYGGAQSNAMLALSAVSKDLNKSFVYVTKRLPKSLSTNISGNLKNSLDNGMKLVEVDKLNYDEIVSHRNAEVQDILAKHSIHTADALFIPQGIACSLASVGVNELMDEIIDFISYYRANTQDDKDWKVLFASGTGTTALYANMRLIEKTRLDHGIQGIEVVAIPCLGDEKFIVASMTEQLSPYLNSFSYSEDRILSKLPTILSCENAPHSMFAKPCPQHLDIWQKIQAESNINTFDLLYAPRAFEILLSKSYKSTAVSMSNCTVNSASTSAHGPSTELGNLWNDADYNLLYYHCGGAEGNISMLNMYRYKGLLPKL